MIVCMCLGGEEPHPHKARTIVTRGRNTPTKHSTHLGDVGEEEAEKLPEAQEEDLLDDQQHHQHREGEHLPPSSQ